MSTACRFALASGLVTLLLLSACSTPVRVNGAEVDGEVPFLSVLEREWRDDVAKDEYAQLAAETGCWLLREPKTGTLQPRALCGPIRHLEDRGKPGVFDELEFEPQLTGDRQVTVDPDSIDSGDTGVEVPPGLELYRPDSKRPVPADQVPEVSIPKAKRGMIKKLRPDQFDGTEPANAVIIAPGFRFTVNRIGTPSTIEDEGARPSIYAPADNEEFIAFTVTRQTDPDFDHGKIKISTAYSLRWDGGLADLKELLGYYSGGFTKDHVDPVTLVASVPQGSEVALVVGVNGVDQTISLRTGERTSTTAAAYYRGTTTFGVNRQYAPDPYVDGDYQLQHAITFTEASVAAFDPDRGWAPEGQMWFYLGWDHRTTQRAGDMMNLYADSEWDPKSLRLTDPAGKDVSIIAGNPAANVGRGSDGAIVAQLPVSTTAIKLTYAPSGSFRVSSSYASRDDVAPKQGKFAFRALNEEIKLS